METVFLKFVNMGINAGWIVLAVLLLRLVLKRAPKIFPCLLWLLVGIRLLCPVFPESMLSLLPAPETIPQSILCMETGEAQDGSSFQEDPENLQITVPPVQNEGAMEEYGPVSGIVQDPAAAPASNSHVLLSQYTVRIASVIWLAGIAGMLLYALTGDLRIRRKVRISAPLKENIRICDQVSLPFVFGIFHPRIYLPSGMAQENAEYVIAHEKAHIKRKDHLWKPLGFLLLSVYWFSPLLWLAYFLFCRDLEAACDESVVKTMTKENRVAYSEALLSYSMQPAIRSLSFGGNGVRARIRAVLQYRKPGRWITAAASLLCTAACICFLTNPITKLSAQPGTPEDPEMSKAESVYIDPASIVISYGEDRLPSQVKFNVVNGSADDFYLCDISRVKFSSSGEEYTVCFPGRSGDGKQGISLMQLSGNSFTPVLKNVYKPGAGIQNKILLEAHSSVTVALRPELYKENMTIGEIYGVNVQLNPEKKPGSAAEPQAVRLYFLYEESDTSTKNRDPDHPVLSGTRCAGNNPGGSTAGFTMCYFQFDTDGLGIYSENLSDQSPEGLVWEKHDGTGISYLRVLHAGTVSCPAVYRFE